MLKSIFPAYMFALLTNSSLMKFSISPETLSLDNDLDLKPGPNFDYGLNRSPEMDLDLYLSLDIDPTSSKLPLWLFLAVPFMNANNHWLGSICTTVNPEIFARILFSRNFAYAKFRENKILAKWRNHFVVY